ncbi:hypothetical protein C8J57DRAFT_1518994 [Mycena rebaudengoi]|nr:hypothetical protein C8J57DRAFT_1518994 [Mycena rebaudengoi]
MNEDVPMLGAVVSYSRTRADGEDSGTQAKKQAISGPSRIQYDELKSDARLLREELTAARRLRKEAEEEISHRDKLWTAHLQTFEKEAATAHHQEIAGWKAAMEHQDEQMRGMQAALAALQAGQQSTLATQAALQAEQQRADQLATQLQTQQVSHEKAMASKTNEIAAIMERVRPSRPLAPPPQPSFPAGPPHVGPTFLSNEVRNQRRVTHVMKNSSTRIPTLQLQLPAPVPSTQLPDDIPMLGPVSESMIEGLVKKILTTMMIGEVGVKQKKNSRAPTQLARERRAQQAQMSPAVDKKFKEAVREVWKTNYDTHTAAEFMTYVPASVNQVAACHHGEYTPADDDFTLDFGPGFMMSLWNRHILNSYTDAFIAAKKAAGSWSLQDVSRKYILSLFTGQLKRSQEEWARWQPKWMETEARYETVEEVDERVEEWRQRRQLQVNGRTGRQRRYDKRSGAVAMILEIQTVKNAPDVETWEFFKRLVERLGIDGGRTRPSYRVRVCPWRALPITDYLRIIDDAASNFKSKTGAEAFPRNRENGPVSRRPAPAGLPRKMYDEAWLAEMEKKRPAYFEDLEVSQEAFEYLVAATSTMAA